MMDMKQNTLKKLYLEQLQVVYNYVIQMYSSSHARV